MKFKEQDIPTNALKELGLHDGKKDILSAEVKKQLLSGSLTDFVQLKNIPVNGENISIDAKLSLRGKPDGSTSLLIHPIYSKKQEHSMLSTEENELFQKEGVHAKKTSAYGTLQDHGSARYKFEEKGQPSYYVRLAKPNGDTFEIWGKDLERALKDSKHEIGDKIQLNFNGSENVRVEVPNYNEEGKKEGTKWVDTVRNNWEVTDFVEEKKKEKTFLFEYDDETKSFVGVDADDIVVPETVNGMHLTPEQKREFKEGNVVTFPDDTTIQASPAKKNGIISNKRLLIASVLFDGGISFAMYHIIKAIANKFNESKKLEKEYARGYLEALNKMKGDLQKKQAQYPNNKEITRDLNILGKEISAVTAQNPKAVDLNNKNVNEMKQKVNDPELDDNALRVEKEEAHDHKVKESETNELKQEQHIDTFESTVKTEQSEEPTISTGFKR